MFDGLQQLFTLVFSLLHGVVFHLIKNTSQELKKSLQ
jgi:hypothetical protein